MVFVNIEKILKNVHISGDIVVIVASIHTVGVLRMMFGDIIHAIEIHPIVAPINIIHSFARVWVNNFEKIIGASRKKKVGKQTIQLVSN